MTALSHHLAPCLRSHGLATSGVDEGLLRERVSLYLRVLFFIQLGFMCACAAVTALGFGHGLDAATDRRLTAMGLGLVMALGMGAVWIRRGRLSSAALQAVEAIGTVLITGIYVDAATRCEIATGSSAAAANSLVLVAMTLVLRAALIPSAVMRTLLVGLSSMALGACWAHHGGAAAVRDLDSALPAAAFVAVTAVISQVIYARRRHVDQLGPYLIERKLGEGGMGVVYAAKHVLLGRRAAVKLLPMDEIGERSLARFEREVQQTSRLEHPNSVTIYDYGRTADGQFYYAMEYLDGLDLDELVQAEGPLPPARVVHILSQAAAALSEAHAIGLVHRDVKPANIMICDRGQVPDTVKVLDFGLVKELSSSDASLTIDGHIVGTPLYLAPETIVAQDAATPASDVYALGVVAYYLLTGRHVFESATVVAVCAMHLSALPDPPSRYSARPLPPALEAIVLRALAKDPSARFADCGALAAALAELDLPGWSTTDARRWWQARRAEGARR